MRLTRKPGCETMSSDQVPKIRTKYAAFCFVQLLGLTAIYRGTQSTIFPSAESLYEYWDPSSTIHVPGMNSSTIEANTKRLPTLEELVSSSGNYECPEGSTLFENIVLPENITHANRKIPKVIHMTAKSRCVTPEVREHIMKWKFPDHSLYLHDDAAVYKLLDYCINDRHGYELVKRLSKAAMCLTSGATLSDFWRYSLLYHHGGIYTDLDNGPGINFTIDFMQPDTDSFFIVEGLGIMSQYFMASSRHHPILLLFLTNAINALYSVRDNVMVNNPAKRTGPAAVKRGMIMFQRGVGIESDGYVPEGIYDGALDTDVEPALPWYDRANVAEDGEYASPSELLNRTVTVHGNKSDAQLYIKRSGLVSRQKYKAWASMNMTHYHLDHKKFPTMNKISCQQHVARMTSLTSTNTSFYYNKSSIADLIAKYDYHKTYTDPEGNKRYIIYFDTNTDEILIPWTIEEKAAREQKHQH
mmetsp:Transcript_5226/g.15204  ORF Transcript_5226/g.15204 Transcript_5226/m.15204 type:complete len:471 (-) Transcript_5226:410-1822(-)